MKKKFVISLISAFTAFSTHALDIPNYHVNLTIEDTVNGQLPTILPSKSEYQLFDIALPKLNKNSTIAAKPSLNSLNTMASTTATAFGVDQLVSDDGRYTFYHNRNFGVYVYDNVEGNHTLLNFNAVINNEFVHVSENTLITAISPNGRYFIFAPDYYDLSFNKIGSAESYTSGLYLYDRANSTVIKLQSTDYYDVAFINQNTHLKISNDGVFLTDGVGYCFNVHDTSGPLYIKGSACYTVPELLVRNLLTGNTKQITSGNTPIDPVNQGNFSYSYQAHTNDNATQVNYVDFLPNNSGIEGAMVANNFALANEANRISVAMTPQTMPFLMPAAGGNISYGFNISNRTEDTVNLTLRRWLVAPTGQVFPIFNDAVLSLAPTQSLGNLTNSFSLPSNFPQGRYDVQYILFEGSNVAGFGRFNFNKN